MGGMKIWNRPKEEALVPEPLSDPSPPALEEQNDSSETSESQPRQRRRSRRAGLVTPPPARPCQVDIYYQDITATEEYDQDRIQYLDNSDQERMLFDYQASRNRTDQIAPSRIKPTRGNTPVPEVSRVETKREAASVPTNERRSQPSPKAPSREDELSLDLELELSDRIDNALTPSNTPTSKSPKPSQKSPLYLNRQAAQNISNEIRSDEFALIE